MDILPFLPQKSLRNAALPVRLFGSEKQRCLMDVQDVGGILQRCLQIVGYHQNGDAILPIQPRDQFVHLRLRFGV